MSGPRFSLGFDDKWRVEHETATAYGSTGIVDTKGKQKAIAVSVGNGSDAFVFARHMLVALNNHEALIAALKAQVEITARTMGHAGYTAGAIAEMTAHSKAALAAAEQSL